jgi:hypothetical protein
VRDEEILEKLTTHDIQDVAKLFSLADKCARAIEGRAWHTPPALEARKASQPNAGALRRAVATKTRSTTRRRLAATTSYWLVLPLP